MLTLERVIEELRRTGGSRLVLASDSEPRVTCPQGELELGFRAGHREIITLVEGIVPAARFADLVMMEPVNFELRVPAGDLTVRVVPGPAIWRVTFTVMGERLEPLPEGKEEPEPQQGEQRAAVGVGSGDGHWGEIEQLLDNGGEGMEHAQEDAPDFRPEPDGLSSSGGAEAEPPRAAEPPSGRPSMEGALVRSRKTSEVELLVSSEAEERFRRGESFATGSTVQLSAQDLAEVARRTASVALGASDDGPMKKDLLPPRSHRAPGEAAESPKSDEEQVGGPSGGLAEDADEEGSLREDSEDPGRRRSERVTTGSFEPVQPIEIELGEDEVHRVQIDGLDRLLDAAFGAGATSVLLRDRRMPAMGFADELEPLPGARIEDGNLVQKLLDLAASPSHVGLLDIEGFCRFVYKPGGGKGLVRCTLVRDGGSVAAWLRRIGDEHLPVQASRWLPASVRNALPESGLVLVAGAGGHGKTTTASALAALCQQASIQTLLVADPLERRLPADSVGVLQRQIPEDVPSAGRALGDALRLEAKLGLVDIPRPEAQVLELLTLAAQGRLVISTWVAPDSVAAVEALLDALPPSMPPVERSRRARALRSVVTVKLVRGRDRGVQPIFEVLPVSPLFLEAMAHGRIGSHAQGRDLVALGFEASLASLRSRGLI